MTNKIKYQPVVQELIVLIKKNGWEKAFDESIRKVHSLNVPLVKEVTNIEQYLDWINALLTWVPSENIQGKDIYNHLCAFYFFADQPSLRVLQNKIVPHDQAPPLTPFSKWLVDYANAMGTFLDTPESLTEGSEKSFYNSPLFNMHEYIRPRGGWKSFNQIFARNFKPGYRPVAAISDQTVIVSPADSTFDGQWEVRKDSHITLKNMHWKVSELLEGSPYKERFTNGIFMHAFLNTTDYHRQHAPVGGKVLEARVIPGQVYLEVEAVADGNGGHSLKGKRTYDAPDNPGYQFAQARGLIVLETPIGLVAVLPIGMAQVSSVVMTAEVGMTVRKGEELSYFQFGGSDIILVFEGASNVNITAQVGVHHKMGTCIGHAFPVLG